MTTNGPCTPPAPTRPLLRYFGGKWQLRHWIIDHFVPHRFYGEPFSGPASVLMAKDAAPGGEIINDLNRELINLFRVMQHPVQSLELERRLAWTLYAEAELKRAHEPSSDPIEQARRTIVRSFMGIEVSGVVGNGTGFRMANVDLRRLDQSGKRTFRNCARDWGNWKAQLPAIRKRLEKVMIYERDAIEFIQMMDVPDCLLYIDPPYHTHDRSDTRYVVEFGRHRELVRVLLGVRAMVVLSGYPNRDYHRLESAGWICHRKEYRANMSLRRRTECLWISPNLVAKRNGKSNEQFIAPAHGANHK